jgi:hypothetical protein
MEALHKERQTFAHNFNQSYQRVKDASLMSFEKNCCQFQEHCNF